MSSGVEQGDELGPKLEETMRTAREVLCQAKLETDGEGS